MAEADRFAAGKLELASRRIADARSSAMGEIETVAAEAAAAMVFNSTAGNPHGMLNYDRTFQSSTGPQETASRGLNQNTPDTQWGVGLSTRF